MREGDRGNTGPRCAPARAIRYISNASRWRMPLLSLLRHSSRLTVRHIVTAYRPRHCCKWDKQFNFYRIICVQCAVLVIHCTQLTNTNTMETTTSSTRAQESNEWTRKDMTSAYQKQLCIVDPYRFTDLLLNVAHNVRTVTPEAIREQFERDLKSNIDSAREVLDANLCEIYAAALADRADIQEPEDDMGENYLPSHPDALRVVVGDNGSRTIVGAGGYLRMRREALDEGQDLAPWTELEKYPAE